MLPEPNYLGYTCLAWARNHNVLLGVLTALFEESVMDIKNKTSLRPKEHLVFLHIKYCNNVYLFLKDSSKTAHNSTAIGVLPR